MLKTILFLCFVSYIAFCVPPMLSVLVPTYAYWYWCPPMLTGIGPPMLTCIGAHLCSLVLVHTYAYWYWCPPMRTCIGASLCLLVSVPTYAYWYWCPPMLSGIGAHICLLVLVPTYAYLYLCPPVLRRWCHCPQPHRPRSHSPTAGSRFSIIRHKT